jgi:hypothetical protein
MQKIVIASQLSSAVYSKCDVAIAKAKEFGYDEVFFWSHADTQAMLCENKDEAWLVWRGTEPTSFADVWHNLSWPRLERWSGEGRIHSGYKDAFNMLRPAIDTVIAGIRKPLYVTGHSMGGALATVYCSANPLTPTALYSFCATKALNQKAADQIICETNVIGNKYDVAVYWPPLPGAVQVDEIVHVGSGNWYNPLSRHGMGHMCKEIEKIYK